MGIIKFRVWDKDEKRMREVNAIDFKNREFLELEDEEGVSVITCPKGKFPKHFELMQFTGRRDKNDKGNELYSGDIITFTPTDNSTQIPQWGKIYYDEQRTAFCVQGIKGFVWDCPLALCENIKKQGNIYETVI